jgi:hypothetical protein
MACPEIRPMKIVATATEMRRELFPTIILLCLWPSISNSQSSVGRYDGDDEDETKELLAPSSLVVFNHALEARTAMSWSARRQYR